MALFKILNNFDSGSSSLPNTYVQGYCYFDKNTGKFWVDTSNAAAGRMALNAANADTLAEGKITSTTDSYTTELHIENYTHSLDTVVSDDGYFYIDYDGNHILTNDYGSDEPHLYGSADSATTITSTLPVSKGGTGVTSIANIQAGKDGDGNTISSTYLKLSGGTMTGNINMNNNNLTSVNSITPNLSTNNAAITFGQNAFTNVNGVDLICEHSNGYQELSVNEYGVGIRSYANPTGDSGNAIIVGNMGIVLQGCYGSTLPASGVNGQIFFKEGSDLDLTTLDARYYQKATDIIPVAHGGTGVTAIADIQAGKDGSGNTISSTYVKKAGDTMTGQLYINKTNDVGGTTAPGTTAPFVLGTKDGQHIEIDSNEILAKSDGTTPGILYLQDGAGEVQICGSEGLQVTAGLLKVTKNSNTVTIGSQNANFCHIYNSASIPFIFNNSILGSSGSNLGSSSYPFTNIYMAAAGQISRVGSSSSYWNGRDKAIIRQTSYTGYNPAISMKTTNGSWEIGPYTNDYLDFCYMPDTSYSNASNTGGVWNIKMGPTGTVYGAVWNDYAEYRKDNLEEFQLQKPGRCVREVGDGTLTLTTKRLERGCEIISDTFGFAIGQDEENGYNTPIASNGRVLAYPFEDIEMFKTHIGWPVCSGPNGTVSIMTEREEMEYPSRIIGTISEIPNYEEWGTGKVKVNGRVWIRIK